MKRIIRKFSATGVVFLAVIALSATTITSGCEPIETEEEEPDPIPDPRNDDYPEAISNFISTGHIADILDVGMTLYGGANAPDISGRYVLDTLKVNYDDSGDRGWTVMNYEIVFMNDPDLGFMVCTYQSDGGGSDCSFEAYQSGSDNCFTVWADTAGRADTCEYETANIFSGCLDPAGDIIGYEHAFFITNAEGDCAGRVELEWLRVLIEDDGVAAWVDSE